jgi:hypothetical protein
MWKLTIKNYLTNKVTEGRWTQDIIIISAEFHHYLESSKLKKGSNCRKSLQKNKINQKKIQCSNPPDVTQHVDQKLVLHIIYKNEIDLSLPMYPNQYRSTIREKYHNVFKSN